MLTRATGQPWEPSDIFYGFYPGVCLLNGLATVEPFNESGVILVQKDKPWEHSTIPRQGGMEAIVAWVSLRIQ